MVETTNKESKSDQAVEHRAQVKVECPACHWRHFLEVNLDNWPADFPEAREIQYQLQEWLRSRCPDHLGPILKLSKN